MPQTPPSSLQVPPLGTSPALLQALTDAVGAAHVLQSDLTPFERDWRGRTQGKALAVVRPADTAQVAQVVKLSAAHGASIVPQGGNTGLVQGGIPDATGRQIVLSLQRMNRVLQIDAQNLTATVQAGCILQVLHEAAAAQSLLYPLSLGAKGSCTLGGNLATNAGGTAVLRYGNTRDLCLGLEFVTAQGEVVSQLAGLRKDNTGFDLRHLLIGSEGTLGIITAATLKLFPMPTSQQTAWLHVGSLADVVRLLGLAQRHLGAELTGFEAMNPTSLALLAQHFPDLSPPIQHATDWMVLLETSSPQAETHSALALEQLLEIAMKQGCAQDGVLAQNERQRQAMWQMREHIPLAQVQDGKNVKHDVSLPISSLVDFVHTVQPMLHAQCGDVRIINYGHVGDGNLHFNVHAPQGVDAAHFISKHEAAIHHIVYEAVAQFGGSFSAEHGVGALKLAEMQAYKGEAALDLMRRIKAALDPLGTLNPHRTVPDAPACITLKI